MICNVRAATVEVGTLFEKQSINDIKMEKWTKNKGLIEHCVQKTLDNGDSVFVFFTTHLKINWKTWKQKQKGKKIKDSFEWL